MHICNNFVLHELINASLSLVSINLYFDVFYEINKQYFNFKDRHKFYFRQTKICHKEKKPAEYFRMLFDLSFLRQDIGD